ncbi:helix-turn-helix transcriptional regulator [Ancylobacter sp. WKF20]|uniref:helix-turn-helix domain-containing protein n=1 Tax=Ancylobacter sp. WKF20 TaxID=3039801 RepID=UPI0024344F8F|nr:helix-turn-helix transcriptional regulator [Ancylobacter sp. WKF20]WGD31309.1 helix-turn-helix transcriptional regulator [Ancylobacter sp. WKF20]
MLERTRLPAIEQPDAELTRLLAGRLRVARQLAGLTQVQAGAIVGTTWQQWQKYENGRNRICPAKLMRFAYATGHTVSWFFDVLENPITGDEQEIVALLATNPAFVRVVQLWRTLPPPEQRTALETTELLAALTRALDDRRIAA